MRVLHTLFGGLTWPVILLSLLGFVTLLFHRRYFTSIRDIPGPFLASFTRLWHVKHIIIGDHNLRLITLHEKFGHFVRISHNEVSISHPDAVRLLLLNPLSKAPWYKITALPDYRFQTAYSTLDPASKTARSKHFASGFSLTNLLHSEEGMDKIFLNLKKWMDMFAERQTPMDLSNFISYATYDVAGEIIFSKQFGFLETGSDVKNAIANTMALSLYAAIAGFYYWLHVLLVGNPLITKMGLLPMGHLFDTMKAAFEERKNNPDAKFDMTAHWFKAHKDRPDLVGIRDIQAQATITLAGAGDTISTAIQSFIYYMIRHPTAYQRVSLEIDKAQTEGRCQTPIISFSDASRLPFLQACIKESLRLFGPFALNIARVAGVGGVTIGSRTFPQGTLLSVNPWVIHHSKECWGEDADVFNPDRWIRGADGTASSHNEQYLIPFGAGYASCPGQNLARIELSKLSATIVRDYDIRPANGDQSWAWKSRVIVTPQSWPVYVHKKNHTRGDLELAPCR